MWWTAVHRTGVVPAVWRRGTHAPGGDATVAPTGDRADNGDRALAGGAHRGAGVAGGFERHGRHGRGDTDRDGAGGGDSDDTRRKHNTRHNHDARRNHNTRHNHNAKRNHNTRRSDGSRGYNDWLARGEHHEDDGPRGEHRGRAGENGGHHDRAPG